MYVFVEGLRSAEPPDERRHQRRDPLLDHARTARASPRPSVGATLHELVEQVRRHLFGIELAVELRPRRRPP